jgi:hypothetical protein
MDVTVQIPDDIAARLCADVDDLSRRALEALITEEYRLDHLDKPDLRRLLGFETSYEIDGFLESSIMSLRITPGKISSGNRKLSKVWDSDECGLSSPTPVPLII